MRLKLTSLFLFIAVIANAQVSLTETTNTYLQNFGTANITAWTNNTTFSGWYASQSGGTFGVTNLNITAAAPTNTGGFYSYRCSGGSDQKIGSRPSGTTGTIYYGLRIKNNSAIAIQSLEITYDHFQFSLAENDGNLNTNLFSYRVAATAITDLTSGTYTSVAALNFSQNVGDTGGNTAQLNGYPCTQTGTKTSCLAVTIPAGSEIMLRFSDVNDAANDHHMGIDNFSVKAYSDNICVTPLPVSFINFELKETENKLQIDWSTSVELNNSYFEIEQSYDGENFEVQKKVQGAGNSLKANNYSAQIEIPYSKAYFRIKQVDYNGNYTFSQILTFEKEKGSNEELINIYPNPSNGAGTIKINVEKSLVNNFKLIDAFGQEIQLINFQNALGSDFFEVRFNNLSTGLYHVIVEIDSKIINKSLLIY